MNKKDLKTGMVIEMQDEDKMLVCGNMLLNNESWMKLDSYNDNMECAIDRDLDIVRVYDVPQASLDVMLNIFAHSGAVIWKR